MEEEPTLNSDEINIELLFLLSTPHPNWQRIQHLFELLLVSDFPLVPPELIQKLGTHYIQSMLKEQPEQGETVTACLLSYQAHGYSLPRLLAEAFEKWNADQPPHASPFPAPVHWSTSALMQIDSSASMDSPVIHAWVYNDEKGFPLQIVICGRGVGWVREQIDNAVLSTALRLSSKPADVLLEGFTCLQLSEEEIQQSAEFMQKQSFIGPETFLTGGNSMAQGTRREDISPAEAMRELVAELVRLEARTGLVEVVKRPDRLRSEFQASIMRKSKEFSESGVTLWQPTAGSDERLIIPFPFARLNIHLPLSLLESPEFKTLHNLYRNDLIRAAAADALRRLNFYTSNLAEHSNQLKTYQDPATRSSLQESIPLELNIDYEVGLTHRVKDPKELTRDEYYGRHVPGLIRMDIAWIRKIKKLIHNLAQAISQADSNLNRLTIARLFDAALRDVPVSAAGEVAQAFETWKKKAQPLLWYLWDRALNRNGMEPGHFCSRQQFFMLDIDLEEKLLTVRPFALADTSSTLFVYDSRCQIPILHSTYDRLVEVEFKPQSELSRQFLSTWRDQALQANLSGARESLRSALSQDPDVTIREILSAYQRPFIPSATFESDAKQTQQRVFPLLAHTLSIRLWSHHAVHSGYAVLQQALEQIQKEPLDSPLHRLVDIPLTLAWLKTLDHFGKDVPMHLKRLMHSSSANEMEREIQRYLHIANRLDAAHVSRCLDKRDLLYSKSLRDLRTYRHLVPSEASMFNILRSLAFVEAAKNVLLSVEELDLSGETPRSIYSKVGPAVDSIWSNPYIQDVSDQTDTLTNMLLGFEVV
jgi:hypothetical protein